MLLFRTTRYDACFPAVRTETKGDDVMGSAVLSDAISSIRDWSVTDLKEKRDARVTGTFGSLVFNDEVQQARLPKAVYHALRRTMTHGEPLDAAAADSV